MSKYPHLNNLAALIDAVSRHDTNCAAVVALDAFSPGYLSQMRDLHAEQRQLEKMFAASNAEWDEWIEEAQAIKREDDADSEASRPLIPR